MLQSIGAGNILNNWPQLVEQAQLMVMMLDSNPVPKTFAESITSEFVSVYSDYCGTQRQMTETLQKKRSFDPEFKENLKITVLKIVFFECSSLWFVFLVQIFPVLRPDKSIAVQIFGRVRATMVLIFAFKLSFQILKGES